MSLIKPLVAVAGLLVGGIGAFNFANTGCPLGTGSCETSKTTVTLASDGTNGDACPMGGCSMDKGVQTVADAGACAPAAGEAACPASAVTTVADAGQAAMDCCAADAAGLEDCDPADCDKPVCCKAGAAEVVEVAESKSADGCCAAKEAKEVAVND